MTCNVALNNKYCSRTEQVSLASRASVARERHLHSIFVLFVCLVSIFSPFYLFAYSILAATPRERIILFPSYLHVRYICFSVRYIFTFPFAATLFCMSLKSGLLWYLYSTKDGLCKMFIYRLLLFFTLPIRKIMLHNLNCY